jgi:hypothetical protein
MGYYFSGNSIKGVIIINDIIENILQKVEPLGLNVLSLTSDMGASNQALWNVWGITTGRHSDIKSKTSHPTVNPEIYGDSIEFLKICMDIFRRMEVGYKRTWKPSQTGVLMSSESLLGLQAELLENRGYDFILTSRFSQDCLENLLMLKTFIWSQVRGLPSRNFVKFERHAARASEG